MNEWDILPVFRNSKENKPSVYLVNRRGHSAEFKANLSVLRYLDGAPYVEVLVNAARNRIKLVPKQTQTAYARNVTSDGKSWVRIGGGQLLRDHFGIPFGKYTMVEHLIFK